eukprot:scaffold4510_cov183-Amphora_coffeaeformis.AAC.76
MKFTLAATALAYIGLFAAPTLGGVNSCAQQQPCVKFTRTLIDENTSFPADAELFAGDSNTNPMINNGLACQDDVPGSCYWLICMELNTNFDGCAKSGDSFSHTCVKPVDTCSDYEGFVAPLSDFESLIQADEVGGVAYQIQCQIVPASVAEGTQYFGEFLLKDASGTCDTGGPYTYADAQFEPDGVTVAGDVEASCGVSTYRKVGDCKDGGTDCGCTGNVGKECVWKVHAPPQINCGQNSEVCELCPPGEVATDLDAMISGETCGHWVNMQVIPSDRCQGLKDAEFATTCGCEPTPVPCDLCVDGEISHPDRLLAVGGTSLTCAEWLNVDTTESQCSALIDTFNFDAQCGCKPPTVDCPLTCGDGFEVSDEAIIAGKPCAFWDFKASSCGLTEEECTSLADFTANCCDPKVPNGGDPHFTRWYHNRESFHGECDLVMVHAEESKFDLHARTTIDSFFSYIESAAFRVDDVIVEIQKDAFVVNGAQLSYKDSLPFSRGPIKIVQTVDSQLKQVYEVSVLHSKIEFKFYKQFLSVNLTGNRKDMAGATGLLGEFETGDMYSRDGVKTEGVYTFEQHAFEWQVSPDDAQLFQEAREPQLPFEQCRMPTGSRPARRLLRSDGALLEQAEEACSKVHKNDFQLCVDDVMMTGDIGLAQEAW